MFIDLESYEAAMKIYTKALERENITKDHENAWDEFRNNGGSIQVKGNPNLSISINSSLYDILISCDSEET